ncbi:MAG: hypothetical protein ACOWYE_10870, partial [Desulfatiglandales bacterium]
FPFDAPEARERSLLADRKSSPRLSPRPCCGGNVSVWHITPPRGHDYNQIFTTGSDEISRLFDELLKKCNLLSTGFRGHADSWLPGIFLVH